MHRFLGRAVGGCAVAALLGNVACSSGAPVDRVGSTRQAITGSDAGLITISGTVLDSSGNAVQAPVTMTLSGSTRHVAFADPFTGKYSFSVAPGSYSLIASTQCLSFDPGVVNLNNLTASTTVNFTGSGNDVVTNCEPPSSSGGTSGTLTISGVVTAAGHPVPGAKVSLNGSSQGFRYADENGAYSFLVNPGSYSVSVAQGCSSYSPSVDNLNNLRTNATANFQGSGNCPPAPLALCTLFDNAYQVSSFGDVCLPNVTTNDCVDRFPLWDVNIINAFSPVSGTDCRFGQWVPPLFNDLTATQTLIQLQNFILYFLGCPYVGTQIGPLNDGLVPTTLLNQGFKFTTADLQALSDDFVAALNGALEAAGAPDLTAAQVSAVQAQLAYLATTVPGQVKGSTFTFSTCGDAGP
jgi:hypothetical protein